MILISCRTNILDKNDSMTKKICKNRHTCFPTIHFVPAIDITNTQDKNNSYITENYENACLNIGISVSQFVILKQYQKAKSSRTTKITTRQNNTYRSVTKMILEVKW